jgi:glutathione S-transferase
MNRQPVVRLFGRSSSHFTRVAAMFACELGITHERTPLLDMNSRNRFDYGGNPALKLPALQVNGAMLFGAENICRKLSELGHATRIVWPEELKSNQARNAQELIWHSMSAQVQLVMGTRVAKLPIENVFFDKLLEGLRNSLAWLDGNWSHIHEALPSPRDVSLLEVTLFCLVEHLAFRQTVSLEPYENLRAFTAKYGQRRSAQRTPFQFDAPQS